MTEIQQLRATGPYRPADGECDRPLDKLRFPESAKFSSIRAGAGLSHLLGTGGLLLIGPLLTIRSSP